jgi:hypothetical protein
VSSPLLPWSLFALSEADSDALEWLAKQSLIAPQSESEPSSLGSAMSSGEAVALSVLDLRTREYHGLCVLVLEDPSPLGKKSLSLTVLTLDVYNSRGDDRTSLDSQTLMDEVHRFCRTHGYTRIHCYAPMLSPGVPLLLSQGFEVDGHTAAKGTRYYSLSLDLPTPYSGDPYDGSHVLNWLGKRFRIASGSKSDIEVSGRISLRSLNPHLAHVHAGEHQFDASVRLKEATTQSRASVLLTFGKSADGNEPIELSIDDLRELTQSSRLDLDYWPPPISGTSIAVEIRREYFNQFESEGTHVYFDSGWYGTLLKRTVEANEKCYIFFVDFETTVHNPEVLGCAEIIDLDRGTPQAIWGRHGRLSSWPDEASFRRYGAIKRKMTAIKFSRLIKRSVIGAGLPFISHSWTYVPGPQAYRVYRSLAGGRD